jgi:hypothetical protein
MAAVAAAATIPTFFSTGVSPHDVSTCSVDVLSRRLREPRRLKMNLSNVAGRSKSRNTIG